MADVMQRLPECAAPCRQCLKHLIALRLAHPPPARDFIERAITPGTYGACGVEAAYVDAGRFDHAGLTPSRCLRYSSAASSSPSLPPEYLTIPSVQQTVTDALFRYDVVGVGGIVPQLLSQPADKHAQIVRFAREGRPPQFA